MHRYASIIDIVREISELVRLSGSLSIIRGMIGMTGTVGKRFGLLIGWSIRMMLSKDLNGYKITGKLDYLDQH